MLRALLTYCLSGTSGLGLQTVLLFVSTALQSVCFPPKGIKVLFLRLACATRLVLQAQASPSADCPRLALQPVLTWPVQWRVASLAGSQSPFLKLQSL